MGAKKTRKDKENDKELINFNDNEEEMTAIEYLVARFHKDVVDLANDYTEVAYMLLISSIIMLITSVMIFIAIFAWNIEVETWKTVGATIGTIVLLTISIYMIKQIDK